MAAAEKSYLRALAGNPRLTSAYSNLIALYRAKGDFTQAEHWQRRATNVLRTDPYYQFALGRRQEEAGNYAGAIDLYRRAIRINRSEALFHFGLARAYSQLGESRRAVSALGVARDLSGEGDRFRYQAKLDALKRMSQ